MRRLLPFVRPAPLLSLCLAASGCSLEPDDPIYLSGTVLEADGSPWRGGPLTLKRPRKVDIRLNEYGGEVWSTRYDAWAEVTPGADGLFLHQLTARDTGADKLGRPHPWTDPTVFQLHLPPREDGARDFLWLQFGRDADVPPLRPWNSNVRAVEEAGGARLSWDALPAVADLPEPTYYVQLRGEQGAAWQAIARSGEPWLTPELMEDFTDGTARVQAVSRGSRTWFQQTLYYNAVSESPPVPLPFPARVPASRGAACAVPGKTLEPCPFTDGRLESLKVPAPGSALSQELLILLREPVRPRRVILRGLNTASAPGEVLHVEGSVDGETWLPLGDSEPFPEIPSEPYVEDPGWELGGARYVDLPLAADAPRVSRIRLWLTATYPQYPGGPPARGSFWSLREVSVFAAPDID